MNTKILISIGSMTTIALPLVAISCNDKEHDKQFSLFNLRSDAKIVLDSELAKRDAFKDDAIHDTNIWAVIEIKYNNAIKAISSATTPKAIEDQKQLGTQNIKAAIVAYKQSNNPLDHALNAINEITVSGDIAHMTSDAFFKIIKDELDTKSIDAITTLDKSSTEVVGGKLMVQFKTNKTGDKLYSFEVKGLTHTGLDPVQYKTLIRLFSDEFGYNHMSLGLTTFKYTLTTTGHNMILENKNNKWMLTENSKETDVTTAVTSSPSIGSKVWGYIQTTLLKKITNYDLSILKEVSGLPSSSETIHI